MRAPDPVPTVEQLQRLHELRKAAGSDANFERWCRLALRAAPRIGRPKGSSVWAALDAAMLERAHTIRRMHWNKKRAISVRAAIEAAVDQFWQDQQVPKTQTKQAAIARLQARLASAWNPNFPREALEGRLWLAALTLRNGISRADLTRDGEAISIPRRPVRKRVAQFS